MPAITDLFGAPVPGQPEPLATDQPRPGRGPKDWAKAAPLLAMLPLVLKKGGPQGLAMFLGSLEAAKQQKAQQAQIEAEKQAQAQRQAMLDRRTFANDAFSQHTQLLDRQRAFLSDFSSKLQAATTPEEAAELVQVYGQFGQGVGVQPGQLDAIAKAVASEEKLTQKRVESFLKQADKDQIDQWFQARGSLMVDGKPVPFERWSKYVPSAVDAQGQPIAKPKSDEIPGTSEYSINLRGLIDEFKAKNQRDPDPSERVQLMERANQMAGAAANPQLAAIQAELAQARLDTMRQSQATGANYTPRQVATFNQIAGAYERSPLVRAADRTIVLEDAVKAITQNPSDPSTQLRLAYSYIQALDTYQSAVREGELGNLGVLGTRLQRWMTEVNRIANEGAFINPDVAMNIAKDAKQLVDVIKQGSARKQREFASRAQVSGVGDMWGEFVGGMGGSATPAGRPAAPGANPFRR